MWLRKLELTNKSVYYMAAFKVSFKAVALIQAQTQMNDFQLSSFYK